MSNHDVDVIVIGGGPIGLSSAYHAAKMGQSVTLLDRFHVGNQNGSSAGHVRMWRIMYTELDHAKLAIQAGDMFAELEKDMDCKLLYRNGLLNFGVETDYTPEGTLETAIDVMDQLGRKYVRLNKQQLETRYPFKNLPDGYHGVFQEDGATIDVKSCISGLHRLNQIYGVDIREGVAVDAIESDANGVVVKFAGQELTAKKLIMCPGSYVNEVVRPSFGFEFNILLWEMCFAYYKITDPSLYFPMFFQFDEARNGHSNLFYGFPEYDFARRGFVRFAVDWASHTFDDVKQREFAPRSLDINLTRDYVQQHIRGVDTAPIDMASALMTHFPDNHSVLDFMPEQLVPHHRNIILCTGGWAFKFTPIFGKICADLAIEGETSFNVEEFSISRPGLIKV